MKVYVAGNFRERERIRAVMDELERAGHVITHDWTGEGVTLPQRSRQEIAIDDIQGVRDAEALVLVDAERGWGMYVEMGVAVALGLPIVVIQPLYDQVFYSLPQVKKVDSSAEAVEFLAGIGGAR